MAQDTRKDPRAKVLSMTVRYKSATVDEFIEHHSHDVSRGGIFIKTPSPFPPGTLLKFEIRIQDEQSVLAGVGRVVWKREAAESNENKPGGMGVKFIKIDDKSKGVIQRLVEAQAGGVSAYEAGKNGEGTGEPPEPEEKKPAAASETTKPATPSGILSGKRAGTMLGLGAIGGKDAKDAKDAKADDKPATATKSEAKKEDAGGFFPATDPEKDMPPPEERTVMKQAAELLKQALGEVGSSIADDLNAPAGAPSKLEKAEEKVAEKKAEEKAAETQVAEAKVEEKKAEEKKADDKAADAKVEEKKAEEKVAEAKADEKAAEENLAEAKAEEKKADDEADDAKAEVKKAEKKASEAKTEEKKAEKKADEAKAKVDADKPKPKPKAEPRDVAPAKPADQPEEGGGGKVLTYLLIAAGVLVLGWLLFGRGETPSNNTGDTTQAQPKPALTPTVLPTATQAAPIVTASAAPTASAASSAAPSASGSAKAAPSASATASAATSATAKPTATPATPPTPPPTPKPPPVTPPPPATPPPATPPPTPKPPPVKKPAGDDPYG